MNNTLNSVPLSTPPTGGQSDQGAVNSDNQSTDLTSSVYRSIDSDLGKFFTTHREKHSTGKNVYWIVLENSDNLNLMRLGVHYRLHPLVLEDLISSEGITKLDDYETHLMLTIPLAFLKFQDKDKDKDKDKNKSTSDQDTNNSTTAEPTQVEVSSSPIIPLSQSYVLITNDLYCTALRHVIPIILCL